MRNGISKTKGLWLAGLLLALPLAAPDLRAQENIELTASTPSPSAEAPAEAAVAAEAQSNTSRARAEPLCKPDVGCVTNLPLPRFVSLKGDEGNARRGPGLTHRIDWVFTHPGMPLMVTAEYENWRRIEDQDGAGGWVHYALLSGVRTVVVTLDMAQLRDSPYPEARVVAQAEMGVVARILECKHDWCRISASGERGWVEQSALWGVQPGEIIE